MFELLVQKKYLPKVYDLGSHLQFLNESVFFDELDE